MEDIIPNKSPKFKNIDKFSKKKQKLKPSLVGGIILSAILLFFVIFGIISFIGVISSPTGWGILSQREIDGQTVIDIESSNEAESTDKIIITNTSKKIDLLDLVLKLRDYDKNDDVLNVASTLSKLDNSFQDLNVPEINSAWQRIVSCVYSECDSEQYLNLIQILVSQNLDNPRNKLINSFIETHQYWDGKNTIHFSKSLDTTNSLINAQNTNIKSKWSEIIKCNTICSNYNNLIFEFIGLINS